MYDYTISNHFSKETLKRFPALEDNEALKALHLYLLKPKIDPDDKRIIIPAVWLATLEGVEWSTGYTAVGLLEEYKENVASDFTWSGWSLRDGKSRRVLNTGWSNEYQELVFQERLGAFDDTGKIWFISGKKVNTKTVRYERERLKMIAQTQLEKNAHNVDQEFIASYMNNAPINTLTKTFQRNMNDAKLATLEIIQSLDKDAQKRELEYFMNSLSVLRTLEDYPQDQYTAVEGGTSRLFALTSGLQNLARPVRKALTKGWYELDLSAAQTAINAKVWNVPNVHEFLADENNNIWRTIANDLDIPLTEGTKDAMKRAFYTLQFGGTISTVKAKFTSVMHDVGYTVTKNLTAALINHWIFQAMYEGRERFIAEIIKNNGAAGYYGEWFSLADNGINTILSHVATSYEMALVRPIFNVANDSRDFIITLYQFDGVSISISDTSKTKSIFKKLEKAVCDKAIRLGINTRLEIKQV